MRTFSIAVLLAGIMMLGLMGATQADATTYAKYDGIDGEATDSHHDKWIDILSVDFRYNPFSWIFMMGSYFSSDGIGTSP